MQVSMFIYIFDILSPDKPSPGKSSASYIFRPRTQTVPDTTITPQSVPPQIVPVHLSSLATKRASPSTDRPHLKFSLVRKIFFLGKDRFFIRIFSKLFYLKDKVINYALKLMQIPQCGIISYEKYGFFVL